MVNCTDLNFFMQRNFIAKVFEIQKYVFYKYQFKRQLITII